LFEIALRSFSLITVWLCNFLAKKNIDAKDAHKTLMILTQEGLFPLAGQISMLSYFFSYLLGQKVCFGPPWNFFEKAFRPHDCLHTKSLGHLLRLGSRPGVGNSFGFVGHMRDKLGIRGPVHVLVN